MPHYPTVMFVITTFPSLLPPSSFSSHCHHHVFITINTLPFPSILLLLPFQSPIINLISITIATTIFPIQNATSHFPITITLGSPSFPSPSPQPPFHHLSNQHCHCLCPPDFARSLEDVHIRGRRTLPTKTKERESETITVEQNINKHYVQT